MGALPTPSEQWREALKVMGRCPMCSQVYNLDEARLFARREQASLIHLTCSACRSYFVAMIVVMGQGMSTVGMVTDLSFEDVRRLHRADLISTDELIEGHELIQENLLSSILKK